MEVYTSWQDFTYWDFDTQISEENQSKDDSKPLREKNCKRYAHVPHRDKPPQVVERRNARERRRVQAVNTAFMRLRKAVPLENNRGKRISKVKTLHYAIEYIHRLTSLLQMDGACRSFTEIPNYYYSPNNDDGFQDFEYDDDF